ncbi:MAG: carboxypeptidase-like regulatory domain-containing protein [Flavobacteriaceae bacterium]|nr:carboxypeptidase-like regulatory domain-containing protein [Flavobacteriaceae bacterium]
MRRITGIVFFLIPFFSLAQTIIQGNITDDIDVISGARVVLKDAEGAIKAYTFSNAEGNYQLQTTIKGGAMLEITALGFNKESIELEIQDQSEMTLDFVLQSEFVALNEMIFQGRKDITQKNDTIIFDAKAFAQGNEEVIEDLLRKIPGLIVESDGTIKVGNQEVEKVMIEGDDFFERGYKILTKNMPAHPVDKIELLQNYSNNRLLKGVEESNRVALNLKLNENAKRIWFGNLTLGHAPFVSENRYLAKANLMNFGKKNKFYFLTNLNNIGYDATGDIRHLIRPLRIGEPASIGDDQSVNNIIHLSAVPPNFDKQRTTFNNAEMLSLNAIFNPTEKLKINTMGFLNWDELDFYRNRETFYSINSLQFINTEDYHLKNKKRVAFGKVDISYNISENEMIEAISKYQNADFSAYSNLIFNSHSTAERYKNPAEFFDQKISYTNKINPQKVVLLTGRFINEKSPQSLHVNRYLFQDLFPEVQADEVNQSVQHTMTFAGFEAHLLDRKKNKNLLEVKLGNAYRKDNLRSGFELLEGEILLNKPENYQNDLAYAVNDLYAKSEYQFTFNNFSITTKLGVHQLFNSLKIENETYSQKPFFINPGIETEWKLNKKNIIRASYSLNRSNADILHVYPGFILTNFNRFQGNHDGFNQLDTSSFLMNYQLGNWTDRFFANTTFLYSQNHDFFSSNSYITPDFTQTQNMLIKDRKLFSAFSSVDYFIKKWDGNMKLNVGYFQSDFKNSVNSSDLRIVETQNLSYGLQYRSVFDGFFNFDAGTEWRQNKISSSTDYSFTDHISFLDVILTFSEKLNLEISSERYTFGNFDSNKTYYFFDFDTRFRLIENKLTLMLSGKNLFNTDSFKSQSISDISITTTNYRLLPRYILLKAEYRF